MRDRLQYPRFQAYGKTHPSVCRPARLIHELAFFIFDK
jgi:hypothetical protein